MLVRLPHRWRLIGASIAGMGTPEIEVAVGDITAERVDAIVNAANEWLRGGGGVDGAIHRAAGPELAEAAGAFAPCDTGDAVVTPSFGLAPAITWIIHTVGPVWDGGTFGEPELLRSCYRRSLALADEIGAKTLAFPAIATGVYGYPMEAAAEIAVTVLRSTPTEVQHVRLVAFDERNAAALRAAMA